MFNIQSPTFRRPASRGAQGGARGGEGAGKTHVCPVLVAASGKLHEDLLSSFVDVFCGLFNTVVFVFIS